MSSLTSLAMSCYGLRSLSGCGLERLPRLQHLVCTSLGLACTGPVWPADMGALKSTLLSLDMSHMRLASFPLAVTQLTALHCLKASWSHFPVVTAGITALNRLVTLELGREDKSDLVPRNEHLVSREPLDANALGDLSSFGHLRTLSFQHCEVKLSGTFSNAAGHVTLANLVFDQAYPAQECMVAVLQYRQELQRRGRGRVLQLNCVDWGSWFEQVWQGQARGVQFKAMLEACGF